MCINYLYIFVFIEHPNLKAIITHGGPRSVEEAIFYGVPIVGLPIVKSRRFLLQQIAKHGAGVVIDPKHLSIASIKKAVTEVVTKNK